MGKEKCAKKRVKEGGTHKGRGLTRERGRGEVKKRHNNQIAVILPGYCFLQCAAVG